jgi:SAM-dependent methyltransferase
MNRNAFYRILEHPWVYRFSQRLLSFGGDKVTPKIQQLTEQLPATYRILDIGCGPSSLLWQTGLHPIGLDLSHAYALAFHGHGDLAITGSAVALPFLERSFDGVWSIGLLHHLRDDEARRAVEEMIRICRPGGYIVVFDAVLPNPGWRHPVAYLIRRSDRGRYVRREEDFKALLPFGKNFIMERITYSLSKLEGMLVYGVCP